MNKEETRQKQYEQTYKERVAMLKDIGKTYGRPYGALHFAKKYNLTKQRIHQLVVVLRKEGVNIPMMRGGYITKAHGQAIQELLNEQRE